MDRRTGTRQRTIYRPAFVRSSGALSFVVMRNISPDGAGFTGSTNFRIGETISYFVADEEPIEAEVVWVEGDSFGVMNHSSNETEFEQSPRPYRSVRIPMDGPVRVYINGFRVEGSLRNLSQRGACIESPDLVSPGQLITIEFDGLSIEAAVVTWARAGRAGVKFPEALRPQTVSNLLTRIQEKGLPTSKRIVAA